MTQYAARTEYTLYARWSTETLAWKFVTRRRPDDWVACLRDDEGVWESGRTEAEALGKLIISIARQS